ncbi:hypothetical protein M1N67_01680 [Peptococcaceae bacterium]|nr:hypothetical protein [Peptococcaceae bacterium]
MFKSAKSVVALAEETITQIVNNYRYDRIVKTSGTIAGWLEDNDYILTDGTSSLVIDLCPPWYKQFSFNNGDKVTVVGELGINRRTGAVEIDVFTITMSNGEVITLRNADGPPPWAGPPHKHHNHLTVHFKKI